MPYSTLHDARGLQLYEKMQYMHETKFGRLTGDLYLLYRESSLLIKSVQPGWSNSNVLWAYNSDLLRRFKTALDLAQQWAILLILHRTLLGLPCTIPRSKNARMRLNISIDVAGPQLMQRGPRIEFVPKKTTVYSSVQLSKTALSLASDF